MTIPLIQRSFLTCAYPYSNLLDQQMSLLLSKLSLARWPSRLETLADLKKDEASTSVETIITHLEQEAHLAPEHENAADLPAANNLPSLCDPSVPAAPSATSTNPVVYDITPTTDEVLDSTTEVTPDDPSAPM